MRLMWHSTEPPRFVFWSKERLLSIFKKVNDISETMLDFTYYKNLILHFIPPCGHNWCYERA